MTNIDLTLEWSNEQEAIEITPAIITKLEELLQIAGSLENVSVGEVALTFVDDTTIQELNKQYRGLDKPTDVLSFAMQEAGEDEFEIVYEEGEAEADGDSFIEPLGDIIISVPTAIVQAEEYGHSLEREIGFLFVHGFLHLIGYDHQDEEAEKQMFAKQEEVLQKAGLTR